MQDHGVKILTLELPVEVAKQVQKGVNLRHVPQPTQASATKPSPSDVRKEPSAKMCFWNC